MIALGTYGENPRASLNEQSTELKAKVHELS